MYKIGIVYISLSPYNIFIEAFVDQLIHRIQLVIFN